MKKTNFIHWQEKDFWNNGLFMKINDLVIGFFVSMICLLKDTA